LKDGGQKLPVRINLPLTAKETDGAATGNTSRSHVEHTGVCRALNRTLLFLRFVSKNGRGQQFPPAPCSFLSWAAARSLTVSDCFPVLRAGGTPPWLGDGDTGLQLPARRKAWCQG